MEQNTKPKTKSSAQGTEKLNEYIRIGNSGIFLLITGFVLILAALTVWGLEGNIPVTTTQPGVVMERRDSSNGCVCFVNVNENTGIVPADHSATVTMPDGKTYTGSVSLMPDTALSAREIRRFYSVSQTGVYGGLNEWTLDTLLGDGTYFYILYLETEEDISAYWHEIIQANIVLREEHPISLLLS